MCLGRRGQQRPCYDLEERSGWEACILGISSKGCLSQKEQRNTHSAERQVTANKLPLIQEPYQPPGTKEAGERSQPCLGARFMYKARTQSKRNNNDTSTFCCCCTWPHYHLHTSSRESVTTGSHSLLQTTQSVSEWRQKHVNLLLRLSPGCSREHLHGQVLYYLLSTHIEVLAFVHRGRD